MSAFPNSKDGKFEYSTSSDRSRTPPREYQHGTIGDSRDGGLQRDETGDTDLFPHERLDRAPIVAQSFGGSFADPSVPPSAVVDYDFDFPIPPLDEPPYYPREQVLGFAHQGAQDPTGSVAEGSATAAPGRGSFSSSERSHYQPGNLTKSSVSVSTETSSQSSQTPAAISPGSTASAPEGKMAISQLKPSSPTVEQSFEDPRCFICDIPFTRQKDLERHESMRHVESAPFYRCMVCQWDDEREYKVKEHCLRPHPQHRGKVLYERCLGKPGRQKKQRNPKRK